MVGKKMPFGTISERFDSFRRARRKTSMFGAGYEARTRDSQLGNQDVINDFE